LAVSFEQFIMNGCFNLMGFYDFLSSFNNLTVSTMGTSDHFIRFCSSNKCVC